MPQPYSIGGINRLPEDQKKKIYSGMIPGEILERFNLTRSFIEREDCALLQIKWEAGNPYVEIALFHEAGFPDPIFYCHLTDRVNGQILVLLYILNDPEAPRFNVDRMPEGTPTPFGTVSRNLEAEKSALEGGLSPGQVRRGLRLISPAITAFEKFVTELGHDIYFIEPLYYHNAVIYERYGFAYQQGRKLMERIHSGLSKGCDLLERLDGSIFRSPKADSSIRLRSWAIHDGILGELFSNGRMYKRVGIQAGVSTAAGIEW